MKWYIDKTKLFWYNKLVTASIRDSTNVLKTVFAFNGERHNPNRPSVIWYFLLESNFMKRIICMVNCTEQMVQRAVDGIPMGHVIILNII